MEYGYDTFSTVLLGDIFELLLELGNEMGIDPFSSIESENYFRELLKTYSGNKNEVKRYFEDTIKRDFQVMKEKPRWIQGDEWQFHRGKPMIFVGQLDTSIKRDGVSYGISFFVFWDYKDGVTKTVTQSD